MKPEIDVLGGGLGKESRAPKQGDDRLGDGCDEAQLPSGPGPLLTRGVEDLDKGKIGLNDGGYVENGVFVIFEAGKNCLHEFMRTAHGYGRWYSYGLLHRFHWT